MSQKLCLSICSCLTASLLLSCLPQRESSAQKKGFSISSEVNRQAITRESRCQEEGGQWKGESCVLPKQTPQPTSTSGQSSDPSVNCSHQEAGMVWNGSACIQASNPKNFFRYCSSADTLPPELAVTVARITTLIGSSSCQSVWDILRKKQILSLQSQGIRSVEALRGLSNVEKIQLADNQISDISVLAGITSIRFLDLRRNKIEDLTALRTLRNLETLYLSGNPVRSIAPLKDLKQLREIQLEDTPLHHGPRTEEQCPREAQSELIRQYCSAL